MNSTTLPDHIDEVPIADEAIGTLTVPGYPDFLVADGRSVWATNVDRVERLTVDRPGPVATIEVPGPCGAMVVADGSLWVASCRDGSVYRLDRASGSVAAHIPTGLADPDGELSLAAGSGSVWVLTSADGVLSRIDTSDNEITAEIAVLPRSYAAAYAFGSVWTTSAGSVDRPRSVQRIDPVTNAVVATIAVGPDPRFLAAGEGAVWTLNWGDGSVSRIDPRTNMLSAMIPLRMEGGAAATLRPALVRSGSAA